MFRAGTGLFQILLICGLVENTEVEPMDIEPDRARAHTHTHVDTPRHTDAHACPSLCHFLRVLLPQQHLG